MPGGRRRNVNETGCLNFWYQHHTHHGHPRSFLAHTSPAGPDPSSCILSSRSKTPPFELMLFGGWPAHGSRRMAQGTLPWAQSKFEAGNGDAEHPSEKK